MKPILAAMLSVSGTVLTDAEKRLLEKGQPIGVSLFKRNVENPNQVRRLTDEIRSVIGRDDVLIAMDQEGGRVCRYTPTDIPTGYYSEEALGTLTSDIERDEMIQCHAFLISDDLRKLGVNWVYAPVLDVSCSDMTDALKGRCFSDDEKKVASCGRVMVDAYVSKGICPCVKHLPGHGRAVVDPHLSLPVLDYSLNDLERDFYPFEQVAPFAPAGMTAHIVIPEIDDKPITQSAKGIKELIRGKIGFDGLLISDAIDMHALKGSLSDRVQNSLSAGCDVVCYCFGKESELKEVIKSASFMTDKALDRFKKIKDILSKPVPLLERKNTVKRYMQLGEKTLSSEVGYDAVETLHKMEKRK